MFFTLTKPSLSNRRQVGTKTFSVMVIYCETKDVMFSLVHRQCVKRKHCMTALHFIMTNKSEESFLSPLMGKPDESSFSFAQQIRSDRYINRGGTTLWNICFNRKSSRQIQVCALTPMRSHARTAHMKTLFKHVFFFCLSLNNILYIFNLKVTASTPCWWYSVLE